MAVLGDLILPEDEHSAAASTIGAADFVDEWVSAPFPGMERDRAVVENGLAWFDTAARDLAGVSFIELDVDDQARLCDRVCGAAETTEDIRAGVEGFDLLRRLVAAAFYTSPEGLRDLQYLGNTPQDSWGPPPEAALRHVGLI